MIQIEKVEIKYFRSVYNVKLRNVKDVTVLSGKNDCGKSNILRALNLFFNNQTDWNAPLNFENDFSFRRREEARKQRVRQFIQIKLHFIRGKNRYVQSLPEKFWVCRTWFRDSIVPQERNSLREGEVPAQSLDRAQASLQKYLNTIHFEYVPAVKDKSFFNYSLGALQDAILKSEQGNNTEELVDELNKSVKETSSVLSKEFKTVVNIETDIQLPTDLSELFRAFQVMTGNNFNIPLTVRGDGIQARFLPSLLHYIATKSKKYYIWGFEEPENCLEHALATDLADSIINNYSKESQFVITSHSPAFVGIDADNTNTYRVFFDSEKDTVAEVFNLSGLSKKLDSRLYDEIGLLQLQQKHQQEYKIKLEEYQKEKDKLGKLYTEAQRATSNIVLVEGESDVLVLSKAWIKLYSQREMLFRIISSDVSGDHEDGAKAGIGIVAKALESCRVDLPLQIGLFDHDQAGLKAFELDRNFKSNDDNDYIKIHSNQHVAAIIYHGIAGKEEFLKAQNLCIEFLFREEDITKQVERKGLVLEQKKQIISVEGGPTTTEDTTEPHHRKITGGKMDFAKFVVPTLPVEAFENFKIVFNQIEETFELLK